MNYMEYIEALKQEVRENIVAMELANKTITALKEEVAALKKANGEYKNDLDLITKNFYALKKEQGAL